MVINMGPYLRRRVLKYGPWVLQGMSGVSQGIRRKKRTHEATTTTAAVTLQLLKPTIQRFMLMLTAPSPTPKNSSAGSSVRDVQIQGKATPQFHLPCRQNGLSSDLRFSGFGHRECNSTRCYFGRLPEWCPCAYNILQPASAPGRNAQQARWSLGCNARLCKSKRL